MRNEVRERERERKLPLAAPLRSPTGDRNLQVGSVPGVIVMALQDGGAAAPQLASLDPQLEQMVVVFNARCATPVGDACEPRVHAALLVRKGEYCPHTRIHNKPRDV